MVTLPHNQTLGSSGSDPLGPPGTLREVFGHQRNQPPRAAELGQHHAAEDKARVTGTRAGSRPAAQTKTRRRASAGGHFTSAGTTNGNLTTYRPSRRATTTAALPWCEDSAHRRCDDPELGLASDCGAVQPSPQASPRTATSRSAELPACSSCLIDIMAMTICCIIHVEEMSKPAHNASAGGGRQPAWWPRPASCSAP